MMYWIVFAFFTCLETLTDVFLSFWFPFYYEVRGERERGEEGEGKRGKRKGRLDEEVD